MPAHVRTYVRTYVHSLAIHICESRFQMFFNGRYIGVSTRTGSPVHIYYNLQSLLQAFGCDNESRNVDVILSISSQPLSPYMVPTESAVCIRFSCGLDFGICNPLFLTLYRSQPVLLFAIYTMLSTPYKRFYNTPFQPSDAFLVLLM